jgi:flagellar M-ring protein FliF
MDQIRTTTEDVLPAASRSGLQATGVVVREREVLRDGGGADTRAIDTAAPRAGSAQRDVEYAVGRRVEQVVSQPGSIRRVQVVAVVRKALDVAQEEQLRKVLAAAVGASIERGDTVVVQSLSSQAIALPESGVPAAGGNPESPATEGASTATTVSQAPDTGELGWLRWLLAVALAVVAIAWIVRAAWRDRLHGAVGGAGAPSAALSDAERAAALSRVRDWLNEPSPASAGTAGNTRRNG